MRPQIYFSFHVFMCILMSVSLHGKNINVTNIMTNLHVSQKLCGPKLSDMLNTLCASFYGPRRKRGVFKECCETPCTAYYIMKHYCMEPVIPIETLPPQPSSTVPPTTTTTWPLPKILLRPDSAQSSIDRVSQSSENNYSGQVRQYFVHQRKIKGRWGKHKGKHKRKKWCRCRKRCKGKIPLSNQINKEKEQLEVANRPPPKIGRIDRNNSQYVIFAHSKLRQEGHHDYSKKT